MAWLLLVVTILVGVRVVFRLLVTGWARPWAERYLAATAPEESEDRTRYDDPVLESVTDPLKHGWDYAKASSWEDYYKEREVDRYDPTGAAMYRGPKWTCWTGDQVQGGQGNTWQSRQPTLEAARREAAELFGVPESEVQVTAFASALPMTEDEWIDPLKE